MDIVGLFWRVFWKSHACDEESRLQLRDSLELFVII